MSSPLDRLDAIAEDIHSSFEQINQARDQALKQARLLTRHCARAIRAAHRDEHELVDSHLRDAGQLADALRTELSPYPELYFAGYTQDALKEYAEACIVKALFNGSEIPSPQDLQLENNTYTKGLSEVVGELRRRCLDILRHGYSDEAERLLTHMDDIYGMLITMDFPDAITRGLRRQTDIARGILERTRGDLTMSQRQQQLQAALTQLESRLDA